MPDHQEANIWTALIETGTQLDTGAAGQRAYHSASSVTINCTKKTRSHGQENHCEHGQENHCKRRKTGAGSSQQPAWKAGNEIARKAGKETALKVEKQKTKKRFR